MNFQLFTIFILLVFNSCTPPSGYYWGNYSQTLYQYKKNQTKESYDEHKNELLTILEESDKKGLRVPPGVCAELGYIYLIEGNNEKASSYFNKEKTIYPESSKFMDSLIQKMDN